MILAIEHSLLLNAAIGLSHRLGRRIEIDARGFKTGMANLLLDDSDGQLEDVDIVHNVAMTKAVDSQFVEMSSHRVLSVCSLKSGLVGVSPEDMTDAIFRVGCLAVLLKREKVF